MHAQNELIAELPCITTETISQTLISQAEDVPQSV